VSFASPNLTNPDAHGLGFRVYSTWGFEPRDEIVFKSIVRLLKSRLETEWRHELFEHLPVGTLPNIVFTNVEAWEARGRPSPPERCRLSFVTRARSAIELPKDVLRFPPRADDVLLMLRFLGRVHDAAVPTPTPATTTATDNAPPVAHTPQTPQTSVSNDTVRYRLTRWPPVSQLDSAASIRIATALSASSIGLAHLSAVTGQPKDVCVRFIERLNVQGLIEASGVATQPAEAARAAAESNAAPVTLGLFQRIRQKLGL
jgi:hypothetical protein